MEVIGSNEMESIMRHTRSAFLILATCFTLISPTMASIDIVFDYCYDANNFFDLGSADGLAARARMQEAGSYFESIFADDLAAIIPSGPNHWTPSFYDPSTGVWQDGTYDMTVPADTIIIYIGGRDMSALGSSARGGYSVSGTLTWKETVKSRGENPITDFGPWGGSISFDTALNSSYSWNFSTDAPGFYEYDFLSVAIHEIAHVLGFGSADSWDNLVNTSNNTFLGTESVAEYGEPVPLDSINAHWAVGTMSELNGIAQEAAMDPNIANGQRKFFTNLDNAALDDLGWDVVYPPTLLVGDANRDGVVSAGDYGSVQANFGHTGLPGILGDANLDGVVSAGDYASVQANFGHTSSIGIIPEPATFLVMTLGSAAVLRKRRLYAKI